MGRPPRAASASTRIVGFRLTEDEERRLDELVMEQGHKDRSALLRAWLARGGPASTTAASSGAKLAASAPAVITSAKDESRANIRSRHVSAPNPSTNTKPRSTPSTTASASAPTLRVFEQVLAALRREHDPHLGLISIAKVVRSLVPRVLVNDVHAVLLALHEQATIELRPEAGSEFLHDSDATLCPRGPRETVFSFARLLEQTNTTVDDEAVLSALRKLASREPPGSLLSVRTLRTMQKLPASRFDAAVLRLARAGKVILHHHDFPTSLPEAEREMLVQDELGTHYVGIAPKQGSVSSNET